MGAAVVEKGVAREVRREGIVREASGGAARRREPRISSDRESIVRRGDAGEDGERA